MSIKNTIVGCVASLTLLTTGLVGGYVGTIMQQREAAAAAATVHYAELAERTEQIATDEAAALIADFAPTVDAASALVASSDGKATAESRDALQATIDRYTTVVTPLDDAPRIALPAGWTGTNPLDHRQAVRDAQKIATPAIADASKVVADEVAAWQVAEDARIAAEAEAARKAEEERAAAERRSNSNSGNGGGSSNSNGGGSNSGSSNGGGGGSSNSNAGGGGGFDPAAAVASAGCRFEWTDSGTSRGGGAPGAGCWVKLSTSLSGDRLYMTTWHEIAHGRLFSQSHACNAAQSAAGTEVSANWWTSKFKGFTVPQHGMPADTTGLNANCGW